MPYGLNEKTIKQINSVFSDYHAVDKAILYGSRAKNSYKNGSDIDLTLLGDNLDLPLLQKISLSIDDLLLPYKVDLSIYNDIQNSDLKEHIDRVGIVFYDAGVDGPKILDKLNKHFDD